MARAYKIYLEPADAETRTAYLIDHDDDAPTLTNQDTDAFDAILCDNDGYYVDYVAAVSLEEAKRHSYYG